MTLKSLVRENEGSSEEDDEFVKKMSLKAQPSKNKQKDKAKLERVVDDENIESIFDPTSPSKPSPPEEASSAREPAEAQLTTLE